MSGPGVGDVLGTAELVALLRRVDEATLRWKGSKSRADEMDAWDAIAALDKHGVDLAREVVQLRQLNAGHRTALIDQEHDLSQILGRALGLPEEGGQVQTFDLTAEDLAVQAAAELARLRALAAQAEAGAGAGDGYRIALDDALPVLALCLERERLAERMSPTMGRHPLQDEYERVDYALRRACRPYRLWPIVEQARTALAAPAAADAQAQDGAGAGGT